MRAGGRIPLIIGRGLTNRARESMSLGPTTVFKQMAQPEVNVKGFSLAQKMVGKACGVDGVVPGAYCEPKMGTVGSQDTTGPMTRDELKDLACLGFQADLVMQSFCHTAAYPKPVDVKALVFCVFCAGSEPATWKRFQRHPKLQCVSKGKTSQNEGNVVQVVQATQYSICNRNVIEVYADIDVVIGFTS